ISKEEDPSAEKKIPFLFQNIGTGKIIQMKINLKIWRQKDKRSKGEFCDYILEEVNQDMSFLEMLDMLNNILVKKGERAVEFDHDCREGICGQCGMMINGIAHGP